MADEEVKVVSWEDEARAIINDIKGHVKEVKICSKYPSNELKVYLNLTTFESDCFCIKVSGQGFQIVGKKYDSRELEDKNDEENNPIFETPYALLSAKSNLYIKSFGNQLTQALNLIADKHYE